MQARGDRRRSSGNPELSRTDSNGKNGAVYEH